MNKFLLKTIKFLIPILVSAILLEILVRQIPNDYLIKKEYLDKHSGEIETLILGSSQTYYDLDPGLIRGNSFNAGYVSQSLLFDFEILKKYEKSLTNLKTIILPVSYVTLFRFLKVGEEDWRVKNYLIYYDMDIKEPLKYHFEILSNDLIVNLKRLIGYYFKKRSFITSNDLGWGFKFYSNSHASLEENGRKTAELYTCDINSSETKKLYQANLSLLDSIIEWSEKRGIKVVLFMPPSHEAFNSHLDPEQLRLTYNAANKIVKEHKNCCFFDFLNDLSFTEEDYYDANHLSDKGAKKLTVMINDTINNL